MKTLTNFFKEAYYEFQKVKWPSKKQTLRLTLTVIGVSLGVGAFILLLDYIFKNALNLII